MSDLISRQDAINIIDEVEDRWMSGEIDLKYAPIMEGIQSLPSAPDSRQRGEWVPNHIPDSMLCECDQCGFDCGAYAFNFCPNCGADMRRGGEDK